MTAVLDSIRRIVAEDAAHAGTTHEVYLRRETIETLPGYEPRRFTPSAVRLDAIAIPIRTLPADSTRRDCIATIRRGQVISVTNL